ncbi:RDR1, partial [Enterospora canceri]
MQESELSAIKQVVDDQERLLFVIKDDFYGPISKEADELFDSISNSVIKAEFTLNPVRYFNESASTPSKCSLGHDNLNFYGGFAEERKIVIYQAERVEKNERAFRISSGETVTLFSVKKGSSKAGELLQSGLFDFIHFGKRFDKTVETGFISARLLEFFRLLKEMESREVFVYATEAEMRILWQILKHRVEGTFDSTQWRITAGTFKNYKDIKVNLVLTSSVSQLHRLGRQAKVILFSRVYVHLRAQLFLMLSPDQKDELDQFCSYEHKLAEGQQKKQDVLSRLKCILVDTDGFSNNCFFCSDSEVVQFYAFVEETKQALLRSPLVEGVELFNNNFFVTARTSSRCAVKSVFGACRFPVEYPVRPAVLNATVLTDSVEIGTVVNYYQFIGGMKFEVEVESDGSNSNNSNKGSNKDDSNKGSNNYDNSNNNDNYDSDISDYRINLLSSNNHSKPCSKFITEFSSNEITIFFRNYMIQIRRSSVEKIIAEYDRIDADGHVDVYVLLKTLPRVYSCQDVKYATVCMKYQNMAQLKLARWDRCTREEIDWFERRGDIKFTVQLDQSGVGSAPNEVNFVDVSPSSVLEHLVAQLAKFYPVVHYSEVREPRDSSLSFLDSSQIVAYFTALLDFASLYHVLVLVSWKARFLTDVFTEGDLAYIADNTDVGDFCRHLERRLSHRLDKINLRKAVVEFRQIRPNRFRPKRDHSTTVEIRSVLVTPLRTFYNWEQPNDTNRVLRNFEPDRFLRVSLREDEDTKFQNDLARGQEAVYDFFRRTLLDGMFVGPRKYFFLVMTAAQMSAHNAWFISTLIAGRRVIGADYVRGWLGDFRKIKNIGKYAVRIGQAFSATKEAVGVDRVVVLGDVVRNGYVFTDGAGVITRQLGRGIAESLGLNYVPSAYQIRFGGAKGVVTVQPDEVVEKILVEGNSSNSSNNSSKGDNNSSKDNSNSSK